MTTRRATHSGSWYSDDRHELASQLDTWLSRADLVHGPARAIIAPHAGYKYCGSCAAHAYRQVSPAVVSRIFVLGPSHHVRLSGCALSRTKSYRTPLYDLRVDVDVNEELYGTEAFEWMDIDTDENEHSLEMQLPYIAKVMEDFKDRFTLVPVLVGSLNTEQHERYGRIFSKYLANPENLFVVSSDFCHWGSRFRFTSYDRSCGSIHESIEALDRMGMDIIEGLNSKAFAGYLREYNNTICGRHPIGILLHTVESLLKSNGYRTPSLKFLNYAQSSQCRSMSDSSVSYAAAALVFD